MNQLEFTQEVIEEIKRSKTIEELEWKVGEMKKTIEFAENKTREMLTQKGK